MFLSRLLSKLIKTKYRPKVLIFGASSGGQSQFDEVKYSHNVIGFLDNNPSKHGRKLRNKLIYSPGDIYELCFDKIIIASCYHQEIAQQLVRDFNVSVNEISVFHTDLKSGNRFLPKTLQRIGQTYLRLILSAPYLSSVSTGLWVAKLVSRSYDSLQLTSFTWIDQDVGSVENTLQPELQSDTYGPRILGTEQRRKAVILPAIHLSRYHGGTIHCSSNSVIHNDKLLLWRSPTCEHRMSNYAVGNVFYHGDKYALTTKYNSLVVNKGLAITGSCDVNYYHWMLEVLSKLVYLDKLNDMYADYPILISEKAKDIEAVSTFISQLNLDRDIIYLESNHHYTVRDLLTITPPNFVATNFIGRTQHDISDCYFRRESLEFLRRTGLSHMGEHKLPLAAHERIFLARKANKRIYNQDEVWDLLNAHGFVAIYLEDMKFYEQVHHMHRAKYIVGPTGAAWTNLLFSCAGAKALCWMAEEYGDFSCYSHIAAEMQVELDYIMYKTRSINSAELYYGAYNIDLQPIKKWLEINNFQKIRHSE